MSDQNSSDKNLPTANLPGNSGTTDLADTMEQQTEVSSQVSRFDVDLIKKYPKANRKISLNVSKFGINAANNDVPSAEPSQSMFISPHGIEFKSNEDFKEGVLLKIQVSIPDYWSRKQKFVDYTRVDAPSDFRVLAKVVRTEEIGKRSKKKLVTVQTIIIDDVDEKVLKTFLQEG